MGVKYLFDTTCFLDQNILYLCQGIPILNDALRWLQAASYDGDKKSVVLRHSPPRFFYIQIFKIFLDNNLGFIYRYDIYRVKHI